MINGGVETLDEAEAHLAHVDGVMLGRAAYQNPGPAGGVDPRFFGGAPRDLDDAVEAMLTMLNGKLAGGVRLHAMTNTCWACSTAGPARGVPPPSERE